MNRFSFKSLMGNARAGAIVQSVIPSIVAVVLLIGQPGFSVMCAVVAVLGVACAHLAMNLIDDYFDYKADMLEDRLNVVRKGFKAYTAKYPYLTDGSWTLGDLRTAIAIFSAIAITCGGFIFAWWTASNGFLGANGSWWIVAIAAVTAFLGFFYSAPPIKFCYWGMGEVVTGIIFGPLLMLGMSCAVVGHITSEVALLSIPVGMLVINILYTHSLIDREGDEASDKTTLAGLLKTDSLKLAMSAILNFGPFVIVVAGILLGRVHWAYVFVLPAIVRGAWLFNSLVKFTKGEEFDTKNPPKFLGNMGDWKKVCELGLDWFLARWLTARNLLSGFCVFVILIRLILLIF